MGTHRKVEEIVLKQLGEEKATLFLNLLNQKPAHGDAVVFLQGDRFDRAQKVVSLYRQNYADKVLVVGNNVLIGKGKRPDEDNVSLQEMVAYLMRHRIPRHAIFVNDEAMNTLGQAKETIGLAKQKKWGTLLIVASPYHVLRSYLIFSGQAKEQRWKGKMIFQAPDLPWGRVPSGRTKTQLQLLSLELEKIRSFSCIVRKAQRKDAKRIWEIRSDPFVRKLSSSQEEISFKDHLRWFENTYFQGLKNLCVVAECDKGVAGYCRFDFKNKENAYVVSIAVDPSFFRQGLGKRMLHEGLLMLGQNVFVKAAVKKGNPASRALFEKSNFAMAKEDSEYYYFQFTKKDC